MKTNDFKFFISEHMGLLIKTHWFDCTVFLSGFSLRIDKGDTTNCRYVNPTIASSMSQGTGTC